MTQVWIALMAYFLFYLLKAKSKIFGMSFTNFISVIKTMLFQRVSLFVFLSGESPPLKPKKLLECQPEFGMVEGIILDTNDILYITFYITTVLLTLKVNQGNFR